MADKDKQQKIDQFIEKIAASRDNKLDLSSDEDLSIAIMNLISLEEHFFFTGSKTGKTEYFDLLKEVRDVRTQLLKKIIKDYEGEVWCVSKHLLAASMRLMEVGSKQLGKGDKKEAQEMFEKAYNLYSLFWGLNLNILDVSGLKKIDDDKLDKNDKDKDTMMARLGVLVKKAIDCCIE